MTGMLSGFIFGSVLLSNFFLAAVWLPVIFWMYLKFRKEKHIGYFIGTVLAIASQTLAACPEISIMTLVLLYLHQLWFRSKAEGLESYLHLTLSLGSAVVLALGLSALQLWPTAELMPHSPRSGGLNYEAHTTWSLELSKLATLVISPVYIGNSDSGEASNFFYGFWNLVFLGQIQPLI